ncbi:BRcat domain-containing protein [Aliarcobacter lanthieri]|uniref:BRcat domain-containing protein n=1 Tax=Aliarcobacter lanthieri TaxID=1355374 RepID=UPI003AFAC331
MRIKYNNKIYTPYIIQWHHIDSTIYYTVIEDDFFKIIDEKWCELIDDGIGKNYVIKKDEYGFDNSKVYIIHRVLLDNPNSWGELWERGSEKNVAKEFYEKLKDYETDNDTLDFTAIPIQDNWVFCPIKNCKENFVSFEVDTKKHIVKCPECSTRMYNPYFMKEDIIQD